MAETSSQQRDGWETDDDDNGLFSPSNPFLLLRGGEEGSSSGDSVGENQHNLSNNNNQNNRKPKQEKLIKMYVDGIYKYKHILLGFMFLVLWPAGILTFVQLHYLTDSTFHPKKNSLSALAIKAFENAYSINQDLTTSFTTTTTTTSKNSTSNNKHTTSIITDDTWNAQLALNPPFVISLEETKATRKSLMTSDPNSPAYQAAYNYTIGLYDYLMNPQFNCWKWPDEEECNTTDNWLRTTNNYYNYMDEGLSWIARNTMKSPKGDTAFILVEYKLPSNKLQRYKKQRIVQLMNALNNYEAYFHQNYVQQHIQQDIIVNNAGININGNSSCCDNHQKQYFNVRYTGINYFERDLLKSLEKDILRMDIVVIPLSLVLIGIVLPKSNPSYVWIIPSITIVTTIACWSIVMYSIGTIATSFQISSYAPTVMMSLSLGVGVDYTLFLLARFLEESNMNNNINNNDNHRYTAICNMLWGSGHVLILSGLTLAATFLGLVYIPMGILQSIGLFSFIAILSSLAVNLTIVPALLFTSIGAKIIKKQARIIENATNNLNSDLIEQRPRLVRFASNNNPGGEDEKVVPLLSGNHDDDRDGIHEVEANNHNLHPLLQQSSSPAPPLLPTRSIWRRLAQHLLHPYKGIIILLVVSHFIFPVARRAFQVKSSLSFDLLLPARSPSLMTYHKLEQQIGERLNSYRILFDGREANITMTSSLGFQIMHSVVNALRRIDQQQHHPTMFLETNWLDYPDTARLLLDESIYIDEEVSKISKLILKQDNNSLSSLSSGQHPRTVYNGISVLQNYRIFHEVFVLAKTCRQMKPYCPVELLHTLDQIDNTTTSSDMKATFITATLMNNNPFSDNGIEWLIAAREAVKKAEDAHLLHGVHVHIYGSAGVAYDAVDAVYKAFPTMLIISSLTVFLLMSFFFKSIFPPLRSIVSIAITLAFSFGLAVMVFQDGMLERGLFKPIGMVASVGQHELCWVVPIFAMSIMIGLSMDYDVFLVSRILEYRLQSYEHKSSIACGLHSTGGIISAAGVIMAVAFGSLMFSTNPVLYQWSFLLTTAVLLDTFLVRTIVVPILTNLAGSKYCWWPRQFPSTNQICLPEYQQSSESDDDVAGLLRTLEETSEYESLRVSLHE